jgi:hypothetical protein
MHSISTHGSCISSDFMHTQVRICVYHFLFGRLFNTGTRQVSSRSHKDKREAYIALF